MLRSISALILAVALVGCASTESSVAPAPDSAAEAAPHVHDGSHQHVSDLVGDGTTASQAGYTIGNVTLPAKAGVAGTVGFDIRFEGRLVRDYLTEQTKDLHLYVVRSDLAVFRHLHPTLSEAGTWSAAATLPEAGDYRVIVEFVAKDEAGDGDFLMLGATGTVPGERTPRPVVRPVVGDDGSVKVTALGAGTVSPTGKLRFLVTDAQDRPVNLGSYLGVSAHITGFHVASGSVVHMHPEGSPLVGEDSTEVSLHTTFEKPGDYLCFVQVRVDGLLHSLPVALTVEPAAA